MLKILIACAAALMVVFSALCAITPEKDKFGDYTDGIRYWCDNAYFQNNFLK